MEWYSSPNLRRTTKYFFLGVTIITVLAIIFFSTSYLINVGSDNINTIYVPKVSGVPTFGGAPGQEPFWANVPSYRIPLIQTISYPGSPSGNTGYVQAQMAWTSVNGTYDMVVKLQFPTYQNSGSGAVPSLSVPILNDTNAASPSNSLFPMYTNSSCLYSFSSCYGGKYPQDVGFFPLAQGSTHVYPEQAIVMLGIAPGAATNVWYTVSYKPKLVLGTSGALDTGTGGAAEMWIWSRSPTDNASADTAYPGISYPNGTALNPTTFGMPSRESYAMDGYTNSSSFYQLGALPPSSMFPYINTPQFYTLDYGTIGDYTHLMNPFEVQAQGSLSPSTSTWTVEFVRTLNTSSLYGENNYQLQMSPSNPSNYYIAFAVSQEAASQTYLIYYNSVSFWWRFNFVAVNGFANYNNQSGAILHNADFSLSSLLLLMFALCVASKFSSGSSNEVASRIIRDHRSKFNRSGFAGV